MRHKIDRSRFSTSFSSRFLDRINFTCLSTSCLRLNILKYRSMFRVYFRYEDFSIALWRPLALIQATIIAAKERPLSLASGSFLNLASFSHVFPRTFFFYRVCLFHILKPDPSWHIIVLQCFRVDIEISFSFRFLMYDSITSLFNIAKYNSGYFFSSAVSMWATFYCTLACGVFLSV